MLHYVKYPSKGNVAYNKYYITYMKINYGLVSRSLIALLFVVAGLQKLMDFKNASSYIGSLGVPMATIVTVIVIFIEVVVALAFAWGYKAKHAGYILIAFTVLTILLVHNDFKNQMNLVMALKNLSIIGGILAALCCYCDDCTVHSKKHTTTHSA